ncbi:MAG TPA: thioredoxin family protein [Oculatellaceae cyanobacterium]
MTNAASKKLCFFIATTTICTAVSAFGSAAAVASDLSDRKKVAFAAKTSAQLLSPADRNLQQLTQKAESGDAPAQTKLGLMYAKGLGVPKDIKRAVALYEKAAARGCAIAQFRLAVFYENGSGVQKDLNKAIELYEKSASAGYAIAQFYLGFLYQNGQGVVQDLSKAAALYQRAANQDYPMAQLSLAVLYENGLGVPKNMQKASELYKAAADRGDESAKQALAALTGKASSAAKITQPIAKDDQDRMFEDAMGFLLENVHKIPNRDEALKRLQQGSNDGCAESIAMLALLARYGTWAPSVPRDETASQQLAAIALADGLAQRAEEGRPNAQVLLGLLYENGLGVDADRSRARELALQAAETGTAIAQFAQMQDLLLKPIENAVASQIHPDLQEALASANKAGKLLIVDFFGAWCPWCVKMDETIHDAAIAPLLDSAFWYYKLDVGQFDQHVDCAKKYDVRGIPHIIVFNPDGTPKATSHGYSDPSSFKTFLNSAK